VPSSISNSEYDSEVLLPRRSVLRATVAAGLGATAILGGAEVFWRQRGFRPEINDAGELWCRERERVNGDVNVVTIVGSSRMQFGVEPRALEAALPGKRVVHLAIKGVGALPVFRSLVEDPEFKGHVLCEVTPQHVFSSEAIDLEKVSWVSLYEERPWISPIEGWLRLQAQQRTVLVQPTLELRSVVASALAGGGLPKPPYLRLREDRFMQAHYSWVDPRKFRSGLLARVRRESHPPTEADLTALFARIRKYCERLEERGGSVTFLRMISSGAVLKLEDELFPREEFWDRMLRELGRPGIYFDEIPGADGLTCPDDSHLDVRDASVFSAQLGRLLRERGLA
jgi:hypothetical protein